jgi:hypothetical protein
MRTIAQVPFYSLAKGSEFMYEGERYTKTNLTKAVKQNSSSDCIFLDYTQVYPLTAEPT